MFLEWWMIAVMAFWWILSVHFIGMRYMRTGVYTTFEQLLKEKYLVEAEDGTIIGLCNRNLLEKNDQKE